MASKSTSAQYASEVKWIYNKKEARNDDYCRFVCFEKINWLLYYQFFWGPSFFLSPSPFASRWCFVRISRDDSSWTSTLLSNWTANTLELITIWILWHHIDETHNYHLVFDLVALVQFDFFISIVEIYSGARRVLSCKLIWDAG